MSNYIKECKKCKTQLPAEENVCPVCGTKQSTITKWIVFGVALLFVFIIGSGGSSDKDTTNESESLSSENSIESVLDNEASEVTTTTTEATTTTTETTVSPTEGMDLASANAFGQALDYLSFMPFSRDGLATQLEYEGYTSEQIETALAALDEYSLVDWNEQAFESAENYLDFMSFSRSGLLEQLEFEGFTPEQAEYGVSALEENNLVDWNEQAALSAESYLDYMEFSRQSLIDQLVFEGFTQEQAEYGVTQAGL